MNVRPAILGFATLALLSCRPQVSTETVGPYPANFRDIIQAYVTKTFYDPYSARDTAVSFPQQGSLMHQAGWLSCVRANAKNRFGVYTGLQSTAVLIRDGAVIKDHLNDPFCDSIPESAWTALTPTP